MTFICNIKNIVKGNYKKLEANLNIEQTKIMKKIK